LEGGNVKKSASNPGIAATSASRSKRREREGRRTTSSSNPSPKGQAEHSRSPARGCRSSGRRGVSRMRERETTLLRESATLEPLFPSGDEDDDNAVPVTSILGVSCDAEGSGNTRRGIKHDSPSTLGLISRVERSRSPVPGCRSSGRRGVSSMREREMTWIQKSMTPEQMLQKYDSSGDEDGAAPVTNIMGMPFDDSLSTIGMDGVSTHQKKKRGSIMMRKFNKVLDLGKTKTAVSARSVPDIDVARKFAITGDPQTSDSLPGDDEEEIRKKLKELKAMKKKAKLELKKTKENRKGRRCKTDGSRAVEAACQRGANVSELKEGRLGELRAQWKVDCASDNLIISTQQSVYPNAG